MFEQALTLAEGVGGSDHPRMTIPLLLLAGCYARTQRLTLSEGLYRKSLQMAGIGAGGPGHVKASYRCLRGDPRSLPLTRSSQLPTECPLPL